MAQLQRQAVRADPVEELHRLLARSVAHQKLLGLDALDHGPALRGHLQVGLAGLEPHRVAPLRHRAFGQRHLAGAALRLQVQDVADDHLGADRHLHPVTIRGDEIQHGGGLACAFQGHFRMEAARVLEGLHRGGDPLRRRARRSDRRASRTGRRTGSVLAGGQQQAGQQRQAAGAMHRVGFFSEAGQDHSLHQASPVRGERHGLHRSPARP
jgi:hypothetical protein